MDKHILLFVESISFGHCVRAIGVAQHLASLGNRIVVACPENRRSLFQNLGYQTKTIPIIAATTAYSRLLDGSSIHDRDSLLSYFVSDRAVIEAERPDLIVSEFRFPVTQIAKRLSIPCISLNEATCHSSFIAPASVPDAMLARPYQSAAFQDWVARIPWVKNTIEKKSLARSSLPYQQASEQAGYEPLENFFAYACHGDTCLLSDDPGFIELPHLGEQDHYMGSITWSGEKANEFSQDLARDRPIVYVSLGTQPSLSSDFLPSFISELVQHDVQIVVSKGGRDTDLGKFPKNVTIASFVNEAELLPMADLFIHPGGAMSTYMGLNASVPMLLIPSHANQHFYAWQVNAGTYGEFLRPHTTTGKRVAQKSLAMIESADTYRPFKPKISQEQTQSIIHEEAQRLLS